MEVFKTFCGEEVVNAKELIEADVKRFIKIEYYETKQILNNEFTIFGIEVVKKEYKNKLYIKETANIENVTEHEEEIKNIINMVKRNKVTPISLENIVDDIIKTK